MMQNNVCPADNTQEPTMRKGKKKPIKCFFGELCRYSIGKEYDLTLSIYADGKTDSPECSHRMRGSSRKNLLKSVAVLAVLMVLISLMCSLMRWVRGLCS